MREAKRGQRQVLAEVAKHGPAKFLDFWNSPIQRAEGRHGHLPPPLFLILLPKSNTRNL